MSIDFVLQGCFPCSLPLSDLCKMLLPLQSTALQFHSFLFTQSFPQIPHCVFFPTCMSLENNVIGSQDTNWFVSFFIYSDHRIWVISAKFGILWCCGCTENFSACLERLNLAWRATQWGAYRVGCKGRNTIAARLGLRLAQPFKRRV